MASNESKALTTAPNTNAVAKPDPVKEMLFSKETLEQIKRAAPKHLSPERMARLALTEFRMNDSLANCTPQSIIAAVIQCSQLGLDIGGVLGQAYLVPYKKEAKLMVGYKGYIELAVRSGQTVNIMACAVYAKDLFDYEYGSNPSITHKPTKDPDRGDVVAAYAIAWLKNGSKQFVVLTRADIEKARSCSKMPNSEPWTKFYPEMAKKTAIRALAKQLTLSPELRQAAELDERNEAIDVEFETLTDDDGRVLNAATGEVLSEPTKPAAADGAISVTATVVEAETEEAPKAWAKLNEIGHPIEIFDPNGWSGKFPSVDEFEMMQPTVRKTWDARVERAIAIANGQMSLPIGGEKY